jgi:hypothetical protein
MTPDGRLIVGGGFRWTQETGIIQHFFGAAAVSDDGRTMLGVAGNRPAIWIDGATSDLQPFLTGLGINLTGWTLTRTTAISGDGLTIAGQGIPPDPSMSGAWIAVIPEPTSLALALCGAAVALALSKSFTNLRRND